MFSDQDLIEIYEEWAARCREDELLRRVGLPGDAGDLVTAVGAVLLTPGPNAFSNVGKTAAAFAESGANAEVAMRQLTLLGLVLSEHLKTYDAGVVGAIVQAFGIAAEAIASYHVRSVEVQAMTDVLTGVANRRGYEETVPNAVAEAATPVVLAALDLNDFKQVNDTLGHDAGDDYLRRFAAAVVDDLPPGARMYRTGGDEFVVLFRESVSGDVEQLLVSLSETDDVPEFSWGIATSPEDGTDHASLSRAADARLYEMKAQRGES